MVKTLYVINYMRNTEFWVSWTNISKPTFISSLPCFGNWNTFLPFVKSLFSLFHLSSVFIWYHKNLLIKKAFKALRLTMFQGSIIAVNMAAVLWEKKGEKWSVRPYQTRKIKLLVSLTHCKINVLFRPADKFITHQAGQSIHSLWHHQRCL